MKTIFPQRNKHKESNFKNTLIVIGVFILGFLILTLFKTSIIFAVSPFWHLKQVILNESEDAISFFRSKNSLIDENQLLKEHLRSQESLLISFNSLNQNYTDLLKSVGGLTPEVKVAVGVLTTPPQSLFDVLVVDGGQDKNIQIGNIATLPFGALIGSVTGVSDKTAQITLYTSHGVKTEAILERTQTPVTLTGQGGGNYVIRIPRDIEVILGDRILSPGLNARFLGIIRDVSGVSTDSFKRVLAEVPGGISQIRFLYILK